MSVVADALVHLVAHYQLDSEQRSEEEQFNEGVLLAELGLLLKKGTDEELDVLAEAARRALVKEKEKGSKGDPGLIAIYETWMESLLVEDWGSDPPGWSGNDRVDPVDYWIEQYQAETKDRAGLLSSILPYAGDSRVLDLLLTIIGDAEDEPMARITAFRHFQYARLEVEPLERLVCHSLDAACTDKDPLVREWAILALALYSSRADVEEALVPILMDEEKDGDVRRAAFSTLSNYTGSQKRIDLFGQLLDHDYLGDVVRTWFSLKKPGK